MATVLTSWKEIAAHFRRGVRTVQRWEQSCGLPVRRPYNGDQSSVLAIAEELDEWARMGTTVPTVEKELDRLRALVEMQSKEIASFKSEIRRLISLYLLSGKEIPGGGYEKALRKTAAPPPKDLRP